MHHLERLNRQRATVPPAYVGRSRGFSRQVLVGRSHGSPHLTLSANYLEPGGSINPVLHSFEASLFVLEGGIDVVTGGARYRLPSRHAMVLPLGVPYQILSESVASAWLQMEAPAELEDERRTDTFFAGEFSPAGEPVTPDMRDPRYRSVARFDPEAMDLGRLAGGSDVNAPTVSASMATALLAYSGIGVKMLIDQNQGAQLHTMFVVDYQPTAIAHPHDHPFEEAYVFLEGVVHGLIEGEEMELHPGDVLWCSVGADHGFENRGSSLVRWIEVQSPQPPARHSYRFHREWEYLELQLANHDEGGS